MSVRNRPPSEPQGRRAAKPLLIRAVWVEGPRNEAWNELWRRLLTAGINSPEEEDTRSEDAGSEYDSNADHSSDGLPR